MLLASPSFLYFFQLLNNWPRFFYFLLENTLAPPHSDVQITVRRPLQNGSFVLASSAAEFRQQFGFIEASACSRSFTRENLSFAWEIVGDDAVSAIQMHSRHCSVTFNAPKQGVYRLNLWISNIASEVIGVGKTSFEVDDRWVVAVGDSFCSGEGNPDVPRSSTTAAKWLDGACHRSGNSFAAQFAARYSSDRAVVFTFLCCTGASMNAGVLYAKSAPSQMQIVEAIASKFAIVPDVLLLSVGGNDIGYADIIHALGSGNEEHLFKSIHLRFMYASAQFDELARRISVLRPKNVFFPLYFDISRNENGQTDASCQDLKMIGRANLASATDSILTRLNRLISAKCRENNWHSIPVDPVFTNHGICSTTSRIRTTADSMHLQGSRFGAFHPDMTAHAAITDLLWAAQS